MVRIRRFGWALGLLLALAGLTIGIGGVSFAGVASSSWSDTQECQISGTVTGEYSFVLVCVDYGKIQRGESGVATATVENQGDYGIRIANVSAEGSEGITVGTIEGREGVINPGESKKLSIHFDVSEDAPFGDFHIDVEVTCEEASPGPS